MVFPLLLVLSMFLPSEKEVQKEVPVYTFSEFEPYLHRKNDTTYVINFWATWCKPCVQELPYFDELQASFADKKIKVILVSLDFAEKKETALLPFLDKRKIKSDVVLLDDPDANAWIGKVDSTWSGAIPATLIYNSKKRNFYERSFTREELHLALKENMK